MKHEKTFEAIGKLRDVELELHRLKNALEMADAKREWVGLTNTDLANCSEDELSWALYWEGVLKGRNT
jgi:hypothetical protein